MNGYWWRWATCWFTTVLWVIASYRISRASYLMFGSLHAALKLALSPALFLLRPWISSHGIHYRADIGRGLMVLYPELGVVVSGHAVVGRDLVLTGGNCIGGRKTIRPGDLVIGDDVMLGANAVVLGPVRLGDHVRVGAGAVVVHDASDGEVRVGVPATPLPARVGPAGRSAG